VIQTIRKAWGLPELRKKIIFTLLILLIFRIGNAITVPYIDKGALALQLQSMGSTYFGLLNTISGGAFAMATVFALSIQPYINSSIIIQLLTVAIPSLERLAREGGEEGKKKIQSITRYTTVAIAILQAVGYYFMIKRYNLLADGAEGIWPALVIVVTLIAGSSFVMWMGEQVNEFGVGNGISIILFAGIVARVPSMIGSMVEGVRTWSSINSGALTAAGLTESYQAMYSGYSADQIQAMVDSTMNSAIAPWGILLILVGILALIVFIVFINDAERRIPVQYAKRQVGRKMYGGQSSNLPMKVSMAGVLPVIFAQSIASLPITVWSFIGVPEQGTVSYSIYHAIDTQSPIYMLVYFVLIIGFSYFYSSIQFNPVEIANNLKKQGGFIPGFRPGKPTVDFIKKVLNKITLFGAIYLGIVAICPLIAGKLIGNDSVAIGGTSVIIVVGVALETVKALESQMLMRQYKGFLE
jgi:preprotein translocase subunit SecY